MCAVEDHHPRMTSVIPYPILDWTRPQHVRHRITFPVGFPEPVNLLDLGDPPDAGTEAAVDTEELLLHYGRQGKCIKRLNACLVNT